MTDVMIVNENLPLAGAVTWWRLSGVVLHEELAAALEEAGLAAQVPAPPATTAMHALKRAMNELKTARRLVRPLAGHDGYALVEEKAATRDLQHGVQLVASWSKDAGLLIDDRGATGLEQRLRHEFELAQATVDCSAFGYWLSRTATDALQAVSLRDSGGVYFVPRSGLDTWRALVKVVREVSTHFVAQVPALRSSEAVAAVLDAVQREAEAEVERIAVEVEKHQAGDEYGKRALQTRVDRCIAMDAKVAGYEELLGHKLEALRGRLEQLRAQVTVAIMKADDKPEAA